MATSASAREELLARARVVRELGTRTPGTYLAQYENEHDEHADVVLETYAGIDARAMERVASDARKLRDAPRHPHLVTVISAERIGEGLSIVTEYVDGVPLVEPFFRMSLGARLRAVVDVLAALSAIHASGVVHRGDLLRASFVEKTGRTKLGFAYASALRAKKDGFAPEVLLGDEAAIDARSDVYGAGVLLWEALTGRSLFGVDAPELVVQKQLAGRVEKALPARSDRWASSVLPVVERALAVDPNARYASAAEMAAALRIAVRARLMMHEDVVEELWPAATTPKVQSGVQPAAEPFVVEAQPQVGSASVVPRAAQELEAAAEVELGLGLEPEPAAPEVEPEPEPEEEPEPTAAESRPAVVAPSAGPREVAVPVPAAPSVAPSRPSSPRKAKAWPVRVAVACAVLASAAAVAVATLHGRATPAVQAHADAVAVEAPGASPASKPAAFAPRPSAATTAAATPATRGAPPKKNVVRAPPAAKPSPGDPRAPKRAGRGRRAEFDPTSI